MRKIKYLAIAITLFSAAFVACEEDSDELTGDKNIGGLLKIETPLIGYVVGNGVTKEYTGSFSITQGSVRTNTVDIYKSFTNTKGTLDPADDEVSNEILLKSSTLSSTATNEVVSYTVSYNELITGLTVGGNSLPASDGGLNVGDYWTLRLVSNTSAGTANMNTKTTKVSVGTRFAGDYKVLEAEYYRIGVPRPDVAGPYVGTIVTIESVDAITYKVNNWFGPFSGNIWYFTIQSDVIGIPATRPDGTGQVANGIQMISCTSHPTEMTNVHCGSSNFVTRDDIEGKDKLTMSAGYLNAPGASREIYQVLEKVID